MHLRLMRCRVALPAATVVILLAACSHTEPPTLQESPTEGPFSNASPVRLTFNAGDDDFPLYSRDGNSILYSYAAPARPDRDRCLAILPASGGTRTFSMCETRVAYADTTDVLTPLGLAADGRLLLARSSTTRFAQVPGSTQILLTDTSGAIPARLLTLPVPVAAGVVTWLGNPHWLGDNEFVALGQQMTVIPRCSQCGAARDTVYNAIAVVRGTISTQGAVLTSIAGTEGAEAYGVNAAGSEVLIARGTELFRVPIGGGSAVPVAALPAGHLLVDMDCGNDLCAILLAEFPGAPNRSARIGNVLYTVPFGSVAFTSRARSQRFDWWRVRVSPSGTEILMSISGTTDARDVHLFRDLL